MSSPKRRKTPSLLTIWLMRLARLVDVLLPRSPRLVILAFLLALVGFGAYGLWRRVEPLVHGAARYALSADHIEITPTPDWIDADITSEVVRDAKLDVGVSILDDDLTSRVADAFSFHPWVRKVERVTKLAGPRVKVDLQYRQPVAVVIVSKSRVPKSRSAPIPIDMDATRLPSDGFSQAMADRLPHIVGIGTQPLVGQQWNDLPLIGAARLARLLSDVWEDLHLAEITLSRQRLESIPVNPNNATYETVYQLVTRDGTLITWGTAPGSGHRDGLSDEEKISRLKRLLSNEDHRRTSQTFDLRNRSPINRTAREPDEEQPQ